MIITFEGEEDRVETTQGEKVISGADNFFFLIHLTASDFTHLQFVVIYGCIHYNFSLLHIFTIFNNRVYQDK